MSESTNEVQATPEGVCDQCWAWAEVWLERLAEGKYTNRPLHCDKEGCSAKAAAHILRAITDADAAKAGIAQLTKERDSSQAREAKYTSLWAEAESRIIGLITINKRLNQDLQDVVGAKDKEIAAIKADRERDTVEIRRLNALIASGTKSSGPVTLDDLKKLEWRARDAGDELMAFAFSCIACGIIYGRGAAN